MTTSMLADVWDYESPRTGQTVYNVEGLCRAALGRVGTVDLSLADYDEALAHLLGQVVILERRYDPSRCPSLGGWLAEVLPLAHIDWRRSFYGRRGEKRPLGRLDDLEEGDGEDGCDTRRSGLGGGSVGAAGEVAGDRGDDRPDGLGWLLEAGDRSVLREVEALGLGPPPGARAGARGAARAAAPRAREAVAA